MIFSDHQTFSVNGHSVDYLKVCATNFAELCPVPPSFMCRILASLQGFNGLQFTILPREQSSILMEYIYKCAHLNLPSNWLFWSTNFSFSSQLLSTPSGTDAGNTLCCIDKMHLMIAHRPENRAWSLLKVQYINYRLV